MIRDSEVWKTWPLPKAGTTLRKWQANRCAWCGCADQNLVRDHCHETGLIRGLLCRGCNQSEGYTPAWFGWSNGGDHPANALRYFEVYTNHLGQTPLRNASALIHYTGAEQDAWWEQAEAEYAAGGEWPTVAPWSDLAVARRQADMVEMRRAMDLLGSLFEPRGESA